MSPVESKDLKMEAPEFQALESTLYLLDHPVRIQALSPALAVPSLVLGPYPYLSPDPEHNPKASEGYALSLSFVSDVLKATGQKPDPFADSLHFEIRCPFEIQMDQYAKLAQGVTHFNQVLPLGHFLLPPKGAPSLVYDWKINGRELDASICMAIIQNLLFFFEPLANKLEGLNAGLLSVEEALALAGEALEHPQRQVEDLLNSVDEALRESEIEL